MEHFMNLVLIKNIYIGIPMAALICYLFLLFCFLNVAEKSSEVRDLKAILSALLSWTGGAVLMRLQISPGIQFWYHVSLMGLFTIPILIYGFLFHYLDIRGKDRFLDGCMAVTVSAVLLNVFTGCILPPPEVQIMANGGISYHYHAKTGIWLLAAAEIFLLVYVTLLAHKKIGEQLEYRKKLVPLLIGTLLIMGGNILCVMPWSGDFPFDTLGGVGMAVCFVYIIYKQYLFSFSMRATTGAVYLIAVVVAFLPMIILEPNIDHVIGQTDSFTKQFITVFVVLQCLWMVLVMSYARKWLERILYQKKKHIVESLVEFQDMAASILNKKELYQKIRSTVSSAVPDSYARIFEKRDDHFVECTADGDRVLDTEEEARLRSFCGTGGIHKKPEIAVFKYDDKIYGFLYVELHRKNRLIYDEADCIRQIANSLSGALKNISAYEKVYQVSIHDELTGLYNRSYCSEFIKNLDIKEHPTGMIYLDMDNFKLYNDLYGEETGDQILRWSASQVQNLCSDKMSVFRVGSNEFLIIAEESRKEILLSFARLIQNTILEQKEDKPKVIQPITFSVGIAWDKNMAESARKLFRQARRAAFYAKGNGKNRIEIYEKSFEGQEQSREKGYEQVTPTIFALMAAVDAKDSFTFEHSENVSGYAMKLAAKMGLPKDDIQTAKVAGLLHDIGKIGIPESILKKKGKLTDEEYEVMKTHVENSIEMIHFLPNMNYVIPAVLSHHERYDGKGYPGGVKGTDIPLLGRILAVCDSFDAMVSRRAYKDALSVEYAIGELEKGKGTQFDPDVAEAFIELIEEDPSFQVKAS